MCCSLLQVFYENVDPIISLVHKPTLDRRFASFVGGYVSEVLMEKQGPMNSTERELEATGLINFRALAFSIFFSAVTSLPSGAVLSRYGEEKTHLLATYRKGLELSLVAAGFCDSSSIEVLQAFVLFLSCQMRDESMGRTWPLLGVAIRVAKSQGLHSEPTLFSPVPNEVSVELRRRIWHQIFYLECRAAEVKGYRASLTDDSFSTAFPRNVNDVDLVETRPPRELVDDAENLRFTDMTCELCRFRMFKVTRQIMQKVEVLNRKIRMTSPQAMDQRIADFNRIFRETTMLLDYVRAQNEKNFSATVAAISPIEKLTRMVSKSMEWKCWLSFWCGIPKDFAEKVMSDDARRT
ncbi:c6 transcription factor [Neofusicoccum parvum]|uniref:C6 transcription factor n=1 Tax=Neofusicoccum parvum TaxID=310453 RepID=A0ACB5SLF1_9PEZI|nr:c6 transcription factor [Neofusicoccum parvum]